MKMHNEIKHPVSGLFINNTFAFEETKFHDL